MKKKKIFSSLIAVLMASSLFAGCGKSTAANSSNGGSEKTYTMKIASILSDNDPETLGLKKFQELVQSKSQGKIKVELYPNAQLGAAETYLDTLRAGTIQMASPGSVMAQLQPMVGAPEMPYLFRDWDHARKVLTDPQYTDKLTEGMIEKNGIRALGFAPRSFRVMTFNKSVNKYDDLKGLRLRTPNIPFYIEYAKGVGASPVALPLTELFSALEQHVVDGQENPYSTIETSKLYEVQKYALESNHIFTVHGWYMNEKFFQSLPDELQTALTDAAKEAIDYTFDISIKAEKDSKAALEKAGVKIVVPDDQFKKQLNDAKAASREYVYKQYPGSEEWAKIVEAVK
ncbi:DctP family TRAP transporter solute-binding subunit [Clostridium bovifaecis]|uniref:DctP family TRAP transporter solute-binding subunit n=1 Tax=Clostridium bovifaecis TaxID=2184719 RepID=A0A6I6EYQ6_9CLOT|nr:DctP family TRAP transporter solute-binding subunit [Clostridium bovifaecis]